MKKVMILFLFISLIGCNDDETEKITDKEDIKLVTGIYLKNEIGQPLATYGNPNIYNSNLTIFIFPTVVQNNIKIESANSLFSKVWFVKCNEEKIHQSVVFNSVFNGNTYSEAIITENSEKIIEINSSSILIDISDLEGGYYYKVFVKTNSTISWEIIYKPSFSDPNDVIERFWN